MADAPPDVPESHSDSASPRAEPGANRDPSRYGVLIVDDDEEIRAGLSQALAAEHRVFAAPTAQAGLEILDREEIALVIADQVLPGMTGVEFLERVIERKPTAIRMMLTGYADVASIVRAVNEGRIYRYIPKPWEPDELRLNVRRALETYGLTSENAQLAAALAEANERLRQENLYLRREVERRYSFDQIIGSSSAMMRVFEVMEKVAQTAATVLITGETGTGKDLVARAIHYASPRKAARFVAQNCGALPDTLLESELFGHRRGAFTGAHQDKKGLFELAHGGTIFLDEIGETNPGMQVRLLRVLQDGEVRPLGASEARQVDVRVIAATNKDLRKAVEAGEFREDLYYRLRVVELPLPPLRERPEDIPTLAHHFLEGAAAKMGKRLRGFTTAAMHRLTEHAWSGNVRELENEIERVVALAGDADAVTVDMLSPDVRRSAPAPGAAAGALPAEAPLEERNLNRAVDELKRRMIERAVAEEGSKSRAAERLGIPRQSLQKMMKRLGLS